MNNKEDRRKYQRVPRLTLAFLTLKGSRDVIPGLMVDISLGGVKVLTQVPVEGTKEIILIIEIDGGEKIEIPSEIVWQQNIEIVEGYSFGIEYMNGIEFRIPPEEVQQRFFNKLLY